MTVVRSFYQYLACWVLLSFFSSLHALATGHHQELYESLFPAEIRETHPNETLKSFEVHLLDSYGKFPRPELVRSAHLRLKPRVQGRLTYVGLIEKKYVYDVIVSPTTELVLNVRVHLFGAKSKDWKEFSEKIQKASEIWNQYRVLTDFPYSFRFEIVKDVSKAHFSVIPLDDTRGPYDQFWSRKWNALVIAHEVGHMLGLGDEYETLSSEVHCYRPSLMCMTWSGTPMPHHYYFILRRLIEAPGPQWLDETLLLH